MFTYPNTETPDQVVRSLRDAGVREVRLWVDDDLKVRDAPANWVHVTTAHQAKAVVDAFDVIELSLDNDLNGDDVWGQGKDVVTHLVGYHYGGDPRWPRDGITLHTANGYAQKAMTGEIVACMDRFGGTVRRVDKGSKRQFLFGD